LVSIVTPSLNQGAFIEETILCIKNQGYPSIEHLIVDGGSTDDTLDIIKKYEGTYNLKWISEPDSGMYEAINKGMRKAQGEILAYLNTDDLYLPWTVSVVVEYLNQHQEMQLVYGDLININIETRRNALWFYPKFSLSFLLRRGSLGQPTVFFRKSVVEKVGLFDKSLKLVGDYEYWMRVGKQCKVSKIDEFLAVMRYHAMTLRGRRQQQLLEELERVRERYGAPKRSKKDLPRILDWLRSKCAWAERYMMVKFLFYYWLKPKKFLIGNSLLYPWQRLIEFPGFRVVSWKNLLMIAIPLLSRKCRGNWFILDMRKEI
jgi:glycosyltransferase involved in cell wall biosynthesis